MAHASNTGLNAVSEIGLPLTSHFTGSAVAKAWDFVTRRQPATAAAMESGKTSRLPRFGFGLRKSNRKTNGEQSNGGKSKTSPGSSPGVNRSKSMRVARVQPPPKLTKQSNSLEDEDETHERKQSLQAPSRLRPPHTIRNSHSQPNSRSASPHIETSSSYMSDSLSSQDSTGSTRQTKKNSPLLVRTEGHARSNSFHAREKNAALGKQPQVSGTTSSPGNFNGLPRSRAMTGGSRLHAKVDYQITRAGVPKMASFDQEDGGVESRPVGHVPTKKAEPLANQLRRGSSGSPGGLNKRPSSLIYLEDTHDLNQLASELSRFDGEDEHKVKSERHQYQSRLTGITRQRSPAYMRHDHSSGISPSPSLSSPGSGKHSSRLRPPVSRTSSGDKRPSSAASHYRVNESQYPSRPKSAADTHKVNQSIGHRRQNSQTHQGSRSPSPTSSGRSTPMSHSRRLSELGKLEEESVRQNGRRSSKEDEVTPRRPPAAQGRTGAKLARTPFFRTPHTGRRRSEEGLEEAIGLNELEGTVLVDAEDYRLMIKEVKLLKTALLRLRRELTNDGTSTSGGTVTPAVGMTASRLRRNVGPQNTELLAKIKELTAERDKLQSDVEESKKTEKLEKKRVEDLRKKLKESDAEKSELSNDLTQLRSDRERLLEKVERLHADNHKLEHQLTSLEQSALYECTILDDGEGEGWMDGEEEFTYEDEEATY